MIDAETLYHKLYRVVEDEGLSLDVDEADTLLADFCDTVVSENATPARATEEDPNRRWATYSREGNRLVEEMFQQLVADLKSGDVSRRDLPEVMRDRLNELEKTYPAQGYSDSEVRGELTEQLNSVLDDLLYKKLSYWEDW